MLRAVLKKRVVGEEVSADCVAYEHIVQHPPIIFLGKCFQAKRGLALRVADEGIELTGAFALNRFHNVFVSVLLVQAPQPQAGRLRNKYGFIGYNGRVDDVLPRAL